MAPTRSELEISQRYRNTTFAEFGLAKRTTSNVRVFTRDAESMTWVYITQDGYVQP